MKKNITCAFAAAIMTACAQPVETTVQIVPQPVSITQYKGIANAGKTIEKIDRSLEEEEYILRTKNGKICITAGSDTGIFWAKQTLKQILSQCDGQVPNLKICDKPQFSYRSMLLDCGRHFFSVNDVKTFIDMLAMHKINTLHWHLTEDQGWRIEIKKYPKLTEVGSVRAQTLIGNFRKDVPHKFDGTPYGGFYTQDECREIVAYAAERHITVIPEIEMPGHSVAALASYPELGCTGGPYEVRQIWGISSEVLCAGNDFTMQFLKDVLDEVCDIFPSQYIHIGGDEAPRKEWEKCPKCQKRMADLGMKSEDELQSWIVREIEAYLATKGRRIIGWDEILKGGVTQSATVMSWRGAAGGKTAAALGNDVIMCPNKFFYFDYHQTADPEANGEPLGIGGHVNLEKAYSFNPFEDLDEQAKSHIIGIQANMWTEYVATLDHVQFMVLPRMAAVAEVGWNADGRTSYTEFNERVKNALVPLYAGEHWTYADYSFRNIQ